MVAHNDKEPSYAERSQTGLWNAIDRAREDAAIAKHTADKAMNSIAAHESLCAERYGNLQKHATDNTVKFTLIFGKLDKLTIVVYIGVGIWVCAPMLAGAIFGIIQLIRIFHG